MALLPRYQRIGITTRQPQRMDFTEEREAVRLAENVRTQLDKMTDFQLTKMEEQAVVRGQERVRSEGAQPTLEAIQAKGGPRTIAEKTAYELGSRIAVAEIQNEAEIDISKILSSAERSGASFQSVQEKLSALSDGYAASLSAVDPAAAAILQTNLQGASAKAEARYSNYYVKRQASLRKAKISGAAEVQYNKNMGDAILDETNPGSIAKSVDESSKLLASMGATEKQILAFQDKTLKDANLENLTYRFNTADIDEQGAMLERMKTTPLEGMTLVQTQKVRKSLRTDYNNKISLSKAQNASVEVSVREQTGILSKGGMPSEKTVLDLRAQAEALGVYGSGAMSAIESLQRNMETAQVFRKMTPAELRAEINEITISGIEGYGEPGLIDTTFEANTLSAARSYLNAAESAVKKETLERKDRFAPVVKGLEKEVANFEKVVESGKGVSPDDLASLADSIAKVPEELRGDLPDDLRSLAILSSTAENLRQMTPGQAIDYIKSLGGGIEGVGDSGLDKVVEFDNLAFAKKMLTGMEAELKKSPLDAAVTFGMKDASGNPLEITPIDLFSTEGAYATMQKRINDAQLVSAFYGTPLTYLTPQEVAVFKQTMQDSNYAQQMALLGTIVEAAGEGVSLDIMAEVSKTAPELAGTGALVASDRNESARLALIGMNYLKEGGQLIGFTPTNTDATFKGKTAAALQFLPTTSGVVREVAQAIYAGTAQFDTEFNADKWEAAIDMALGGDAAGNGGIQDVRGIPTLVPPTLNANQIETVLRGITPDRLFSATSYITQEGETGSGQVISERLANALSGKGTNLDDKYTLVSQGGNNYVFALHKPGDTVQIFASDESDELIVVDITRLMEAVETTSGSVEVSSRAEKISTDPIVRMRDTVPDEVQRSSDLATGKLVRAYNKEIKEGLENNSKFFLSYSDWLAAQE